MNLLSADSRERSAYFDAAIVELHEGLLDSEVQTRLGSVATSQLAMLDTMFIPQQKHGTISLPRKGDPEAIPVAIVRPGETWHLDASFVGNTPMQIESAVLQIRGWTPTDGDRTVGRALTAIRDSWSPIGQKDTKFSIPPEDNDQGDIIWGGTHRKKIPVDFSPADFRNLGAQSLRAIGGRPCISLVLNQLRPNQLPSRTLLHEDIHVYDAKDKPIEGAQEQKLLDRRLRLELRARHIEFVYCAALFHSVTSRFAGDRGRLLEGHSIEMLRRECLEGRRDQFEPTGALKKALLEAGLDDI